MGVEEEGKPGSRREIEEIAPGVWSVKIPKEERRATPESVKIVYDAMLEQGMSFLAAEILGIWTGIFEESGQPENAQKLKELVEASEQKSQ